MHSWRSIDNMKKIYNCPQCDMILNDHMFCVNCCSKWTQKKATTIDESKNNGGDTDYYLIPDGAIYCQDIIESRNMNFSQGNIFKAAFCFNIERGKSDYERDLNKIIWFANRELERIKNS